MTAQDNSEHVQGNPPREVRVHGDCVLVHCVKKACLEEKRASAARTLITKPRQEKRKFSKQ